MGAWWCPNCKEEIDSSRVTYGERHDLCGCSVEWLEEPEKSVFIDSHELRNWLATLNNQTCFEEKKTYSTGYDHGFSAGQIYIIEKILNIK